MKLWISHSFEIWRGMDSRVGGGDLEGGPLIVTPESALTIYLYYVDSF